MANHSFSKRLDQVVQSIGGSSQEQQQGQRRSSSVAVDEIQEIRMQREIERQEQARLEAERQAEVFERERAIAEREEAERVAEEKRVAEEEAERERKEAFAKLGLPTLKKVSK